MANPLGTFDPTAVPDGWFDETLQPVGWYDRDLLDVAAAGGSYTLTCDAGAYTIAGQDAAIRKSKLLAADAGAYSIAGQDAALKVGHRLTADAGAYVIAGQDAAFVYVAPGAYTLTCDAGEYVISGQDAAFAIGGGTVADTHDGFWSREWAKLKKREEQKPTLAEVVEIVKESPQVLEVVRTEVQRKYPKVDYAAVRENVQLQRFIAKQLIEAAEEEDDIEAMLLLA